MFFVIFVAFWRETDDSRICLFKINRHRKSDKHDVSSLVGNESVGDTKCGPLDERIHAKADDESANDHFKVDRWGRWVFEAVRGGEHPVLVDYRGSAVAFYSGQNVDLKKKYNIELIASYNKNKKNKIFLKIGKMVKNLWKKNIFFQIVKKNLNKMKKIFEKFSKFRNTGRRFELNFFSISLKRESGRATTPAFIN